MSRLIALLSGSALLLLAPVSAEAACTFLQPVGGGEAIVKKRCSAPRA